MRNLLITTALVFTLAACAGKESEKVAAMQKRDKTLTCREVMLEQNEADFYRATAEKNKQPGVRSILMPLGYISTYMDADEAAGAAKARTEYLTRIYEIMGCDNKLQMADRKNKLVTRQMAETLENSDEDTQAPAPIMPQQPMAQPMMMVPQQMGYAPVVAPGPVGQW